MVKYINVALNDEDYERLERAKGEKSWREFILQLATGEEGVVKR